MSESLNQFEWHDTPVDRISIIETGVELRFLVFTEDTNTYTPYKLIIKEAKSITLDIAGELSIKMLGDMEIHSFNFIILNEERVSGKLGLIVNNLWWGVAFEGALVQIHPDAEPVA
jgi:hypothetical protein